MIVIPMAGLSRRFVDAGYNVPKYMLPLDDASVFAHAVNSFSLFFKTTEFLFICRAVNDTPGFIAEEAKGLGIERYRIVVLDGPTAGQAETVELGLRRIEASDASPITIFNIDTFRPGFSYPSDVWFQSSDGYLEVFEGGGANWSYVEPSESSGEPLVVRTTEKVPISNLCSNGLYHFAKAQEFRAALIAERICKQAGELYIAPLYNHLISRGCRIHFNLISKEDITFCGVPDEYKALQNAGADRTGDS